MCVIVVVKLHMFLLSVLEPLVSIGHEAGQDSLPAWMPCPCPCHQEWNSSHPACNQSLQVAAIPAHIVNVLAFLNILRFRVFRDLSSSDT